MTQPCLIIPQPMPTSRQIERLESAYLLDLIIQTVGVADNASMNRNARVRVRNVSCKTLNDGDAFCAYEANRCLFDEQDPDGDGWCDRDARFRWSEFRLLETSRGGWILPRPRPGDER